ncbi:hypothetical protein [Nonlabens xiamenensis]|uniref:hypothetical protein n=1 Tax=Nonlabens xiamenensis TaxID=2341043 RepID=UPI000F611E1A|nr:hypothetical protein [Nonlabens xiamenensis]
MIKYRIGILWALLIFTSCEDIINEDNLNNNQIILVAPANDTNLSPGVVQFDWQALEGASSYRIQIARPDFINPEQIVWDEIVQDSTGTNSAVNLEEGSYEWRVRGQNSVYVTPYSSAFLEIN